MLVQDLMLLVLVVCCAVAPVFLPPPSRWPGALHHRFVAWRHGVARPQASVVRVPRARPVH
jgi:hypothetical protein